MSRSTSVSNSSSRRMGAEPARWNHHQSEWEPQTLQRHEYSNGNSKERSVSALVSASRERRLTSGPAVRQSHHSHSQPNRRNYSHERPRPISTGRLASYSRQQQQQQQQQHLDRERDEDIVALTQSMTHGGGEIRTIVSMRSSSKRGEHPPKDTSPQTTAESTLPPTNSTDSPHSSSSSTHDIIHGKTSFRDVLRDKQQRKNTTKNNAIKRRLRSQSSLVDTCTSTEAAAAAAATAEEEQATLRLKQAEGKITSLLQELEELKFFSEIEAASPAKTNDSIQVSIHNPQHTTTTTTTPTTITKPKVVVVREKPTTTLSPRRLAGMDRTSLELEAQQLQRQVDILEREKASLEATIELQDASATSRQEDVQRMLRLESTLYSVQEELSCQLTEIHKARVKLSQVYEKNLQVAQRERDESKATADELLQHLQETQACLQKLEQRHISSKQEYNRKLQEQTARFQQEETKWQLQLEQQKEQVEKLQQDLMDANMSLEVIQSEALEQKLDAVQQELSEQTKEKETLKRTNEQLQQQLDATSADKNVLEKEKEQQQEQLADIRAKLQDVESQHANQLQQLKQSLEDREKRRLDDLVVLQQDGNKEYERRLQALQEQLKHQTDRHHMEMEQKNKDFEVKLENEVDSARLEIRDEYETQLREVRAELAVIQLKYEKAKQESLLTQVKSESKDRDAAREWERKDAIRQGELDIMHDKLDRTMRELSEKEARIQQLQEKLSEGDKRRGSALVELEAQHAEEIRAREELLASQRQLWKASEAKLRTELARKENDLVTLRENLDSSAMDLQKELDETRKELENVKKTADEVETLRDKLAFKTLSLEHLQKDLISEQTRHESTEEDLRVQLAKLEGRLSATESTLLEKKIMVEDLEQRMSAATEESSTSISKYESQMVSLRAELESARNSLTIEQSTLADKDSLIAKLESERKETLAKLERMSSLEKSVSTLQRALSEVQAEKDAQADELARIQQERERDVLSLDGSTRQLAVEKEEIAKILERREEDIKRLTESHAAAIAKLESRLDDENSSKVSLLKEMEKLKESLETSNRISESRGKDSMHFQERINELEEQIEQQRKSVAKNVTDSQETVNQLRKQLADAQKAQEEVASTLESLSNEKDEVVDALEQVLNEVQGRDEEIETLTEILEKRDEELEHAKIIATKAIAQAQEIQNKYKGKNSRESSSKVADLESKIESLNVSLEFLASKNEDLQKKNARLESELRERSLQMSRIKEGHGSPGDYGPKENQGFVENTSFSSPSTDSNASMSRRPNSTTRRSRSSPTKTRRKSRNGLSELDNTNAFSPFDETPEQTISKLDQHVAAQSPKREAPGHVTSHSVGEFGQPSEWVADFEVDFDNSSDFHDARSEPGVARTRQSIERDALRKYVRKRYLKHGESR